MTRPHKPSGLIVRAETKAIRATRIANEEAMTPKINLSMSAPARLRGHKRAAAVWRRLMKIYSNLTAQIVTGLDWVLVENYCLSCEELDELLAMRKTAYQAYLQLNQAFDQAQQDRDINKAVSLAETLTGAYDAVLKCDARTDRKKALLHQLSQSLYITPRSRAGVAPAEKEKPDEEDEISRLLDKGISWDEVVKMNSKEAGNG